MIEHQEKMYAEITGHNRNMDKMRQERDEKFSVIVKRGLDLIKMSVNECPNQEYQLDTWFENVEASFKMFNIEDRIQHAILVALLSPKLRMVYSRINHEEFSTYASLKEKLLLDMYVSAQRLYEIFKTTSKRGNESFSAYKNRAVSLFKTYLASVKVTSYEALCDLIIANKIKDELNPETKNIILLKESDTPMLSSALCSHLDTIQVASTVNNGAKVNLLRKDQNFGNKKFVNFKTGLFCNNCKMKDSHITADCRRRSLYRIGENFNNRNFQNSNSYSNGNGRNGKFNRNAKGGRNGHYNQNGSNQFRFNRQRGDEQRPNQGASRQVRRVYNSQSDVGNSYNPENETVVKQPYQECYYGSFNQMFNPGDNNNNHSLNPNAPSYAVRRVGQCENKINPILIQDPNGKCLSKQDLLESRGEQKTVLNRNIPFPASSDISIFIEGRDDALRGIIDSGSGISIVSLSLIHI